MRVTWMVTALLGAFAGGLAGQANPELIVSADWVAERMEDPSTVILHVAAREAPSELIPGAVWLDYSSIAAQAGDLPVELRSTEELQEAFRAVGVSDDTHVIAYSEGAAHMSARVFMTLDYVGHGDRTSVLDGGLQAWKASGRETVSEPSSPTRGEFTAHPREDMLVTADWIAARLDDPAVTLIDARPLNEYTGARDQEGLRGGHIPGAYNLYYEDLVRSREDPQLIDLEDVRARFTEAGVTDGGPVVSYCFIGMRASYTYLVSRYMGYDAKFYDPSWADWGARDDLPVVSGEARR